MNPPGAVRSTLGVIQARIVSGLFLALPVVITFWIIYWLYTTLHDYILNPVFQWLQAIRTTDAFAALPAWWDEYVAPLVAILLALSVLYVLGLFVHSRVHWLFDALLARVPVVATVYQAVSNLFVAIDKQRTAPASNRVVLVEFPHPGMRSLGLVTNQLRDARTGKTILCVCVLTGVLPPAGFTLFVPEENVTDTPWTMNQLIQAILSGGLTVPTLIPYTGAAIPDLADAPRPLGPATKPAPTP